MAKRKYKLNPETLLFERIKYSFRQKFLRGASFFISVLLFASFIMFYKHDFIQSPKLSNLNQDQSRLELQLKILLGEVGRMEKIISDINYNDDHIYRTYFEVDPLPYSLREAGFGGNVGVNFFAPARYSGTLEEINKSLDILAKKSFVQLQSFDEVIEMARTKEKRLAARPAIQPVSIKELTRFGSPFGVRFHPILKAVRMHEGIDLTCPKGTKVFATADGIVLEAGYSPGGFGIRIFLDHGYGYKTTYGHLEKVLVKKGQQVKRGDVIGTVGSTGLSLRPHLHYEVMVNGKNVNPIHYYTNDLSSEEYDKMISLLNNADPGFDIN